jgi:hypothetical protein
VIIASLSAAEVAGSLWVPLSSAATVEDAANKRDFCEFYYQYAIESLTVEMLVASKKSGLLGSFE